MAFNLSGLNGAAQGIVATQPIPDWYKGPIIKTSEGDMMGDPFAQPPPGTPQQPSPLESAPGQGGQLPGQIMQAPPSDPYADFGGAPRDPQGRTLQDIFAGRAGTPPPGWQYQPGDPNQATDQGPYAWGRGGMPTQNPHAAFNKSGTFKTLTDWLRSHMSPAQQQSLGNFGGLGHQPTASQQKRWAKHPKAYGYVDPTPPPGGWQWKD